jgi:hypothetical protein
MGDRDKFDGDYFNQDQKPTPSNGGQVTIQGGEVKPSPGGVAGDRGNDAPMPDRRR